MVKHLLFLLLFFFYSTSSNAQTLKLVPRAGFQYHGLSSVSGRDAQPSDFKRGVPEFVVTYGIDIKYHRKHLAHVLSLQSIALGPSFTFTNQYQDKGIVPTYTGHHTASSIDQAILTYGVEKGSRKNLNIIGARVKFNYSASGGVGFNKNKEAYDSILPPKEYGMQIGEAISIIKSITPGQALVLFYR